MLTFGGIKVKGIKNVCSTLRTFLYYIYIFNKMGHVNCLVQWVPGTEEKFNEHINLLLMLLLEVVQVNPFGKAGNTEARRGREAAFRRSCRTPCPSGVPGRVLCTAGTNQDPSTPVSGSRAGMAHLQGPLRGLRPLSQTADLVGTHWAQPGYRHSATTSTRSRHIWFPKQFREGRQAPPSGHSQKGRESAQTLNKWSPEWPYNYTGISGEEPVRSQVWKGPLAEEQHQEKAFRWRQPDASGMKPSGGSKVRSGLPSQKGRK